MSNRKHAQVIVSWMKWYSANYTSIIFYNVVTGTTYRPKTTKVWYSNESWMFFVTPHLRDNRDLSSFRQFKYLPSGFMQEFRKFLKRKGLTGTIAHAKIKDGHNVVLDIARELWRCLDTDLSRNLLLLSNQNNDDAWKEILSTNIDPRSPVYQANSDLFLRDYQAISFLRKFSGFTFKDVNPELNALEKWISAERACRATNQKFRDFAFTNEELRNLFVMRRLCQQILGPSPSIQQVRESLRVGPGASASCPSSYSNILDKIDNVKTCSTSSASVIERTLSGTPFCEWIPRLQVSSATRLAFVPKKWDIMRAIEVPEDTDIVCQLSLGSLIRERLKKYGLDLDTQAARNGELARIGSINGTILTEDLTSASDTISYELVRFLLPKGWFNWLSRFRSTHVEYDSNGNKFTWRNEKFSAMGNGYTFELETLIFLVMTLVSCGPDYSYSLKLPENIGVFGDDICCPSFAHRALERNIALLGFTPNTEKSYATGYFRESCGQDYMHGAPVRPYFQKDVITDVTQLYSLANGLRRVSVRSHYYYNSDIRYRDVWDSTINFIPKEFRAFGPSSLGDSVIWGNPADGVEGEWCVTEHNLGKYKRGPIALVQRGINLYAYSGHTLLTAWGLCKQRLVSKSFNKDKVKCYRHELALSAGHYKKMLEDADRYGISTATLVPRTMRRTQGMKPRFKRSSLVADIQHDCPAFL